jgi:hypothetical protein
MSIWTATSTNSHFSSIGEHPPHEGKTNQHRYYIVVIRRSNGSPFGDDAGFRNEIVEKGASGVVDWRLTWLRVGREPICAQRRTRVQNTHRRRLRNQRREIQGLRTSVQQRHAHPVCRVSFPRRGPAEIGAQKLRRGEGSPERQADEAGDH